MTTLRDVRLAAALLCVALAPVWLPAKADPAISLFEAVRYSGVDREDRGVIYDVGILKQAGWDLWQVLEAVSQVEAVFAQCGVEVVADRVYLISAPKGFLLLDEPMQDRLLSVMPGSRPMALFVDQTIDGDTAYSYLESAPVSSRGTAWITRRSHDACAGRLLAHELGHILLDSPDHSNDPGNLMAHTCAHSNIERAAPNAHLSRRQCGFLRDRY